MVVTIHPSSVPSPFALSIPPERSEMVIFACSRRIFLFFSSFDEKNRSLPFHSSVYQRIQHPWRYSSNFELKRNASSLRFYLSKFVYVYIYIYSCGSFILFFSFLIFFIPFYAGSSRRCSIPYLWNRARMGWIPVDSFSEWIILSLRKLERSLLSRNLFKYYILSVYREWSRDENCFWFATTSLSRFYFIIFNILRYCGDL